ncbi:cysteine-rich venom protein ophanin-like [Mytilus edulis]|uniref:cysteine-rich venom protein ophanin-like n=1 Tax=Mytilus edulis TaxID=6550 RepID=UPI0039EFC9A0
MGDELSQKEKDQIVSMHNRIRGEVSPAASPALPNLEWEDHLASKAEQWAQGCDFSHNQDKSSALGTVGENIAINQDPIHGGIKHWESEKSHWTYGNSDTGCTGGSCGHYTQVCTGGSYGHYTQTLQGS